MARRRPVVTPEDESWMYQFPHETAQQLRDVITDDTTTRSFLKRGGWEPTRCVFPSHRDRRTIEVVLHGPGERMLQVRFRAKKYLAPGTTAADPPSERYPDIVSRLTARLVEIAEDHPAGNSGWIEG